MVSCREVLFYRWVLFDRHRINATFIYASEKTQERLATKVGHESEKRELLSGLIQYMGNFESGVTSTVELFQNGSIEQAKKNTVDIIDGLGWIVEGIDVLRDLLKIDIESFSEMLIQLQHSLENDDDVMTSDLFENELVPIVSNWKQRMMDVDSQPPI